MKWILGVKQLVWADWEGGGWWLADANRMTGAWLSKAISIYLSVKFQIVLTNLRRRGEGGGLVNEIDENFCSYSG